MFGVAQRLEEDDRAVGRFLIGALGVGFALSLAAGLAAAAVADRTRQHSAWVVHTLKVEVAIDRAQVIIEQGETTRRGYLLAGERRYLDAYAGFATQLPAALERLRLLTLDNPIQQRNVATYRRQAADLVGAREHTIALMRAGRQAQARRDFVAEAAFARPRAVRDTVARMLAEERRLLVIRDTDQQRSIRSFYLTLSLAGALLLLVGIVTAVTLLRFTRDLRGSRDALRGLNDTLEQQVAERTQDLTRANEEIQRFAYIVSHDLRSPLVNVMGFTAELEAATGELTRLVDAAETDAPQLLTADARLAAREDLPEAIRFIRTSTQRMDRLINAILKLSREGRRVLAPEPLDLAEIADTAVAAMRQTIDARGAVVTVQPVMPFAVSDRTVVEQILSNLIENATKYLQPGRPGRIDVTGHRERGRIVIAVADNGRGIAAADHQRIFDLFRRSGAQDQPGEGIGLATVRALAYRLGGTIDVESTLGEGATFRLSLPGQLQEPSA